MEIIIKQDPEGPSELDQRLELYSKNPESGHTMINPEGARRELLHSLLIFYRDTIAGAPKPFNEISTSIEALAYIVQQADSIAGGQSMPFDYTDIKEGYDRKRKSDRKQRMESEATIGIITPRPHPKAEI